MRKSEMSINFKSIKVWNKLPADIRTSDTLIKRDNKSRKHTNLPRLFLSEAYQIQALLVINDKRSICYGKCDAPAQLMTSTLADGNCKNET